MESTFRIAGKNGKTGTVFILAKPTGDGKGHYILVTAAHVLNDIPGEIATLYLREKLGDKFIKRPIDFKIRKGATPLWVQHPSEDVAVMYARIPEFARFLIATTNLLATDEILKEYEIYPGREIKVLGFPFGAEANDAGFPILRTGSIASYPLTPTKQTKTFLMDFEVFGGNSGGVVYFHDPDWHKRRSGAITAPVEVQMILGLVSKQKIVTEKTKSYMEETVRNHQLKIAEVVHAEIIKQTIEMLPSIK
jgi:hypothetical protein